MRSLRIEAALAICLAACLACILGGCATSAISDRDVRKADHAALSRAAAEPGGTLIIDARIPEDYAQGHIPGAVNIRVGDVGNDRSLHPEALRGSPRMIVYGQNPGSAGAVALVKRLLVVGYGDVRLYEPGFDGWRAAGGSVER